MNNRVVTGSIQEEPFQTGKGPIRFVKASIPMLQMLVKAGAKLKPAVYVLSSGTLKLQ